MPDPRYVAIAPAAPVDKALTYCLAPGQSVGLGQRVVVELKGREVIGFVLADQAVAPAGVAIKEIVEVLDEKPLFPPELIPFFEWLSGYYRHPLGLVMATALPLGAAGRLAAPRRFKAARALVDEEPPELARAPAQARLLAALRAGVGQDWVPFYVLRQLVPGADAPARALEAKGLIEIDRRTPAPAETTAAAPEPPPEPTVDQQAVLSSIEPAIKAGRFAPFLLHGVTGSGKTEIYLRAGRMALDAGRTAIILVPEIALTPRLKALFTARFGEAVALLHSGLSPGPRLGEWLRLLDGRARIALGARSALFAPLKDLGLIVVDEEHEPSYKQEEGLRYQARDAALYRGRLAGTVVILGSATPSVVSFEHVRQGKYQSLSLPSRIQARPLPQVEMVDLRQEEEEGGGGQEGMVIFSKRLIEVAGEELAQGQQCLFFLNRRGFASFPLCGSCGRPFACPNCSVTMTWHARFGALVCHYCGLARPLDECPRCHSQKPRLLGLGTERVQEEAARIFAGANIVRLDSDTAGGVRNLERVFNDLAKGAIDILIGTQMLAKGHDFPGISLVGVILADLSLNHPDFRATERTFQLLTQVAGRAGRGERPGRVIIQTFNPDHYSLKTAASHDYAGFFAQEKAFRDQLFYPPASRLIQINLAGRDLKRVREAARFAANLARQTAASLRPKAKLTVIGPAPAPVVKIKNRFRFLFLIKAATAAAGQALLDDLLPRLAAAVELRGMTLTVDVDPMGMG